jgi:NAD-specific glutamate dehydrogenase
MTLDLIRNIKRSVSIHVVHLCGNILTKNAISLLKSKLKPTLIDEMVHENPSKKIFTERLATTLKKYFKMQYEKVFDGVKFKEMMIEWMSAKKFY